MTYQSQDPVREITVSEAYKSLEAGIKVILLDVRTPGEFARGRIAGSINLPVDQVSQKVEEVIPDKSSAIYVYCLSGSRSLYAVADMMGLGYTSVYNVTNGLLAWRAEKLPVSQ